MWLFFLSFSFHFLFFCAFRTTAIFGHVDCGTYGRAGQINGQNPGGALVGGYAGRNAYGNGNGYGYINSNGRNGMFMNDQNQMNNNNGNNNKFTDDNARLTRTGAGISAWGIITIIILVILLGMGGYYGIICYPLICKQERNYDIMDGASTTASTTTPTRTNDFEKLGNYSSRSTTPSVMLST